MHTDSTMADTHVKSKNERIYRTMQQVSAQLDQLIRPQMKPFVLLACILLYWLGLGLLGVYRIDHFLIGLVLLVPYYVIPRGKSFFRFILPIVLMAMVYDTKRYFIDHFRASIRVEEPYWFDKTFFGISTPQGILTPNEWFQINTHPFLDVISGAAYLGFIAIFIFIAAYVYFWKSRTGTSVITAGQLFKERWKLTWSLFYVSILGYITYFVYPAAPPWYVADYGLGPAKMDTLPSAAGCLRFDEFFGIHVFANTYSKAADVFGAIPSLHCAYPALTILYAYHYKTTRVASTLYFLLICFAAVYTNHHYLLDVIWGIAYSIVVYLSIEWYQKTKTPKNLIAH